MVGTWAVGYETDLAKLRGIGQYTIERLANFVNARRIVKDALLHVSSHGARCIEHDHCVFGARRMCPIIGV